MRGLIADVEMYFLRLIFDVVGCCWKRKNEDFFGKGTKEVPDNQHYLFMLPEDSHRGGSQSLDRDTKGRPTTIK
jgi:hypothetical protein